LSSANSQNSPSWTIARGLQQPRNARHANRLED
jgi:hypothetical protein